MYHIMYHIDEVMRAFRRLITGDQDPLHPWAYLSQLGIIAVDDISIEDPEICGSGYDAVRSIRISCTTDNVYDIFVARVKK